MTLKYTLYLDESGDYLTDLDPNHKNYKMNRECLVGGYLCKNNEINQQEACKILVRSVENAIPEFIDTWLASKRSTNRSEYEEKLVKKVHHATGADKSIKPEDKMTNEQKVKFQTELLRSLENKVELVIFENYKKIKIIDANYTYLNVLVDGIMQLFSQLVVKHAGARVELDVIAGARIDNVREYLPGEQRIYIDFSTAKQKVTEHLELMKIKNKNFDLKNTKLTFDYQDDKKHKCLILCDHICNFYFTKNTNSGYNMPFEDGTYKSAMLKIYKPEYLFSIHGNEEKERVLTLIAAQAYDGALFDLCTGIISEGSKPLILDSFALLSEKVRRDYLLALGNYIETIIEEKRDLELGQRVLDKAFLLNKDLKERGMEEPTFELDLMLYQLTVSSHKGELYRMEKIFKESQPILAKTISQTDNLKYAYLYFNRYAVFLMDKFQIKEAYDMLEKVKEQFEAYDIVLDELVKVSIEGNTLEEHYDNRVSSYELAKIIGTQVQCQRYMLSFGETTYEKAVETSENAMKNFSDEIDLRRQYQYRARIECEAGNYEQALEWLCKGYGVDKWQDFFGTEMMKAPFALYHMSNYLKCLARDDKNHKEVKNLITAFRNNENFYIKDISFPMFIVSGNIAEAMALVGDYDRGLVKKYFKAAIESKEDNKDEIIIKVLRFIIQVRYVAYVLSVNDTEKETIIQAAKEKIKALRSMELVGNMPKIIDEAEKLLEKEDVEGMCEFSKVRTY